MMKISKTSHFSPLVRPEQKVADVAVKARERVRFLSALPHILSRSARMGEGTRLYARETQKDTPHNAEADYEEMSSPYASIEENPYEEISTSPPVKEEGTHDSSEPSLDSAVRHRNDPLPPTPDS